MEIKVLNAAGVVQFVRDDMEQGNWTQEEYTVNATFPFVAEKKLERGQRIAFYDSATGLLQIFEIRNVTNIEPEHYQQIIAEHIAVSELSDEHINNQAITDKDPEQALTTVLTGTLWAFGNSTVSTVSSVDISRGTVWQAVNSIAANWNVYIVPRVVFNAAGTAITGRYLDVTDTGGVWRGVRLSIDKNMTDSSVVYDDSNVLTALYGYGGSVDVPQQDADDETEELTFAGEVWTATSEHPAKPLGQTYIEDPAKTAIYGRNGRPRFGFYQNGDIKNAGLLLQKTWEALQKTSTPEISITGTVSDLYRLGYKDQPICLHDIAIVDIPETGESFQLQIIKCDIDLIDPTATRPEIGAYIPNIVYINREENKKSGGGGGGGGRGQDNEEYKEAETYSAIEKNDNMIGMVVGKRNGDMYIRGGQIVLAINDDGGTTALIQADTIDIDGLVTELTAYDVTTATFTSLNTIVAEGEITAKNGITCDDGSGLDGGYVTVDYGTFDDVTTDTITAGGVQHTIAWQSAGIYHITSLSNNQYFAYASDSSGSNIIGARYGTIVTGATTTTLYYLGYSS